MAQVNPLTRELLVKLVYYGPGLGGKTTSLQQIHKASPVETRGQIVSLATPVDRTLYFDFLPLRAASVRGHHVRLQLFTVPGQVYFNATRKLVLTGADGVVFVADSQRERHDANLESFENLAANLETHGRSLGEMPLVLQYNKRDLPNVMSVAELDASLNALGAPAFATCAAEGEGVLAALDVLVQGVMDDLEERQLLGARPKRPSNPEFHRADERLEEQIGRASAELWSADESTRARESGGMAVFSTDDELRDEDLADDVPGVERYASVGEGYDGIRMGSQGSQSHASGEGDASDSEDGDDDDERVSRVTRAPLWTTEPTEPEESLQTIPPITSIGAPRSEVPPAHMEWREENLQSGGPSWAPLFGAEGLALRRVEQDLVEGRLAEALVRLDGVVQRLMEDAATALALGEGRAAGSLAALALGVSVGRWARFREICARARRDEALLPSEALSALALAIELRERQAALRSERSERPERSR